MEQENKNTFYYYVDCVGKEKSFNDLKYYFSVIGDRSIAWHRDKNVPQNIKEGVEYFADKYLI